MINLKEEFMKRKLMMFFTLFLLGIGLATAQTQVRGTIVDESGDPVIGATVQIKGTSQGAITDVEGRFSLSTSSNAVLIVSYVGMVTQEVKVNPNMRIVLKADEHVLEEVVVTGMTSMDKRLFTGATNQLKGDEIKLDGIAEISRALEGRAAGVSVQNVSGTFGTAPKISIRGATSIYGDSKPLWVVDGVIMEDVVEVSADALSSGDATTLISSAIAGLNANDIESFQILKDGSATSIYGARAMAGVIVVTTKRGRAGTSSISYTGEFSSRLVPSYSDFNIMNSQEQMGVYQEMEQKGWLDFAGSYRRSNSGVYAKMYQLLNTFDPVTGLPLLMNTTKARNEYLRDAEMRNTDWFDELFNSNISQLHSVSISSGTDKTSTYASVSALTDPGWYKKSKVNRYTGNLNVSHKILNNLSVNIITNASYRKQEAPGTLNRSVDAVRGEVTRDFDINPYSYSMNTSRALDVNEFYTRSYAPFNILHELDNNYMELDVTDLRFQGELKWNPIKELELGVVGAYKYSNSTREHHIKDNSNQAMAYRAMDDYNIQQSNPFLYTDPDIPYVFPITVLPEGGIYQRTDNAMNSYDFRATAKYTKSFLDDKHIASVFTGMELNSTDRKNSWFNGWGMMYENGEIPFYVYQFFKKSIEEGTNYYSRGVSRVKSSGYFAQLYYNFDRKYTFNSTIRYEGTNRLGKSRQARWLPTWNFAAGWTISEENFFETLKSAVSHLEFRASYSLSGDRGPNRSSSSPLILSGNPYRPFSSDKENSLYISSLANIELTYEKKHELNLGLDVGFLNNRISTVLDVYSRNMFDLIGPINTTGVGGEVTKDANIAEMKSHGVEFSVSTKNIVAKDFKWNTDFIFGTTKTEITELMNYSTMMNLVRASGSNFAKGYPHRAIFSIPFAGLSESGLPQYYDQDGNIISGASINLQSREGVTEYLKYEGPADPKINGSFGNLFVYKNFRLNVFMTYAFGNVIRLDPVFRSSYSDLSATPKEFKNRWVLPGDEALTDIPKIITDRESSSISNISKIYNVYNYSDIRVAKGDFIRLKEVSLTYDFPKHLIGNKVNNLSVKIQATNLLLLYADKKLNGQDPEFYNTGGVSAPVPKQYTLTLRLGL